ncbi:MAG TPA: hypothetical protein VGI27_08490 [Solirubrobacteraceae bacterium]|jgi:uncharacterized protein YneF (UPF0154 family)
MLGLTIAFALGGFALGFYLTYRYAPPLVRARGSTAVGIVICVLVGAAVGLACMYVYLTIYQLINAGPLTGVLNGESGGAPSASPDANIFAAAVYSIASQSGVLLALAAGVHLLGSTGANGASGVPAAGGARTELD